MSCEELREYHELYAMGVLEAPEADELRAHLARPGDPCVANVIAARASVTFLALAAPLAEPPRRLRARVVAMVQPRQTPWSWIAVAAGLVAAMVWFGVTERGIVRRQAIELARLNEILAFVNDPAARQLTFGEGAPRPPRGKVFVDPAKGVLLMASNLTPAPSGKIYEMWIIPKTGNPAPAGLFQAEPGGTATHVRRGPVNLATTAAIAVTLEPEAGSAAPTSQPLIIAAL